MKKYLSLFFVLALAIITNLSIVNAEDVPAPTGTDADTPATLRTDTKEARMKALEALRIEREKIDAKIKALRSETKEKIGNLREQIKSEKDAAKAKIKESRIIGRENALKKFDALILRINNLKDKVNAQITKSKTNGVDVATAEGLVATAETKLVDAKAKIAEVSTLLSGSANELTKENKNTLKTLMKEIETLTKDAYRALNDAIKSLKEARN